MDANNFIGTQEIITSKENSLNVNSPDSENTISLQNPIFGDARNISDEMNKVSSNTSKTNIDSPLPTNNFEKESCDVIVLSPNELKNSLLLKNETYVETDFHAPQKVEVNYPTITKQGSTNEVNDQNIDVASILDNFCSSINQNFDSCIPPTVNKQENGIDWSTPTPRIYTKVEKEFKRFASCVPLENNYLRGCLWSPDGTCLLTNSCDNVFRIFEYPPALTPTPCEFDYETNQDNDTLSAALWIRESELIYDYTWFPRMKSSDPVTCCFASTSRRTPVHLWDAFNGALRASYRPFDHMGESIAAHSIAFTGDGQKLYCGFKRFIQIFNVCRPGTQSERRPKLGKKPQQGGIISCLATSKVDERNIYASGSFCGSVGVYSDSGQIIALANGPRSGVSQIALTFPCNSGAPWHVIAGGRTDSQIFVWDGRQMNDPLVVLHRRVENYQRFQFGVDPTGRYIFTGSQTGAVSVFDLNSPTVGTGENQAPTMFPSSVWRAHVDSCHGISVHPFLPILATTCGQKRRSKRKFVKVTKQPTKRVCSKCKISELEVDASSSTSSSLSSSSDSDFVDGAGLSDEDSEVSALSGGLNVGVPLPLEGRLTRLPIRNELTIWSFPKLIKCI